MRLLKRWIDLWRPHTARPGFLHRFAAAVFVAPVFFVVYTYTILRAPKRGPIYVQANIRNVGEMECELPDVVQTFIYLFGVWEPDITAFMRRRLRPGDTFCDIGANVGYYSLLAAARVGATGRVIAVEASPSISARLSSNIRRARANNIRVANVAATASRGTLRVHAGPAWNRGWTTTSDDSKLPFEAEVPALPLDDILPPVDRNRLRLIKIDVEGTERELFPGLQGVLAECDADVEVVMEVSPRWWQDSQSVEDALANFVASGFHIYRVDNKYSVFRYLRAERVRPPQRVREPLVSRLGQFDIVLSKIDAAELI